MSNFYSDSKIISLSESKDKRALILEMIVTNTEPNLNGDKTSKDFIIKNHQTLVDMPIQVDRFRLESGLYSSLTHRSENDGLKTDSVGVIYEAYYVEDEDDEVTTLYAKAKIWKRYSATCDAIKELHDNGQLKFSWEIVVEEAENVDGINTIEDGYWIGHCIVSNPSYPIAKSTMLVAELKGLNLEKEVKDLDNILIAGMSQSMLREKISAKLEYSQWTVETFMDDNKAVIRDWEENKYYIVEFSVNGEEVEVNEEMKMEGALIWKPVDEVAETDLRVAELEKEKEELISKIAELETVEEVVEDVVDEAVVESTEEIVAEVSDEDEVKEVVADESDKIVEYAEVIAKLSETVKTLESKVEELEPYRLEAEKLAEEKVLAELNAVKESLKSTAQSIVGEGNEITAEMASAVEEADEKALKVAIAEFVIANVSVVESTIKVAELEPKVIVGTEDEDYSIKDKDIELY